MAIWQATVMYIVGIGIGVLIGYAWKASVANRLLANCRAEVNSERSRADHASEGSRRWSRGFWRLADRDMRNRATIELIQTEVAKLGDRIAEQLTYLEDDVEKENEPNSQN